MLGKFQGQKNLVGYSSWGHRSQTRLHAHNHAHFTDRKTEGQKAKSDSGSRSIAFRLSSVPCPQENSQTSFLLIREGEKKGPVGPLQSLQLAGDAAESLWPRERERRMHVQTHRHFSENSILVSFIFKAVLNFKNS